MGSETQSLGQKLREVQDDICRLRDTILYCQGRILRKQIMMEELLATLLDDAEENPFDVPTPQVIPTEHQPTSIAEIVRIVLPGFNGHEFGKADVVRAINTNFPGRDPKNVHNGVANALCSAVKEQILHRKRFNVYVTNGKTD